MTDQADRKYPEGPIGFLARVRESGALAGCPSKYIKVIWALYSRRNPQGFCWPSHKTIAHDAGCSTNTVKRAVRWAKACLGVRIERRSKCNSYYLPMDEKIDRYTPFSKKRRRAK